MGYKIAVVGSTGNVGREILKILAERGFPADEVAALASERSAGKQVSFGDEEILDVQDLANFNFKGTDIVLSSPGAMVSAEFSPKAAKAGAVVIDNTSQLINNILSTVESTIHDEEIKKETKEVVTKINDEFKLIINEAKENFSEIFVNDPSVEEE